MAREPNEDRGGWWPEREEPSKPNGGGDGDGGSKPPRGLASREGRARPPARYSLFVGLAFFALIVVALFNLIGNDDAGILGAGSGEEGEALAEFAAPDAFGSSDGDANVFQDDCDSSRNPCPAEQGRTPACEIDPAEAIRICDLFDKPLAISFWFTRGGDCTPWQNAFDEVASRYDERVNFLSMNIRDDRETVVEIAEGNGWEVPVGLDPDGAVSNLYRVGGCPTLALAYPGGILYDSPEVPYGPDEIEGFIEDLIGASRERAGRSR